MPPRLVRGTQGWYVIFYAVHPETFELERHRKSYNLNRIKAKRDRMDRAAEIMEAIEELLPQGYPWIGAHLEYGIDKFIALKKRQAALEVPIRAEKTLKEGIEFVTRLKCQSDRKETVRTFANASKLFLAFVEQQGWSALPVTNFRVEHAQAYMDHVRLRVGNNTYNNYRGQVIVLFNAMKDRGFLADNPFLITPKVPATKKKRRPFTAEEAAVVLQAAYEESFWLFMIILLHVGGMIRRTEAYRLRFKHFHLKEGYILMEEQDTKNRKEAVVTIPKQLMYFFLDERFTSWPSNYLLFGAAGRPHASQSAAENTYKLRHRNLLIRLRSQGKIKDMTGLSLYSWKDTGMTTMAGFLSPYELRDHARHADIEITMRYYHGEQIIPGVRDAKLPYLRELIEREKKKSLNLSGN